MSETKKRLREIIGRIGEREAELLLRIAERWEREEAERSRPFPTGTGE